MLKITDIDAYYGWVQVIRGVSLEIGKREVISLIGANGAGKTTLLNIISCLHRPRAGKMEFIGMDITKFTPERIVREGIIQVPEGRELFKNLNVKENLEMGAYQRYKRNEYKEIEHDLDRIFKMFPVLKNRINQRAGTLSGGEQQMLAIGRGLMSNPRLMLLDEPSLGLAPLIVKEIFNVIIRLKEDGIPILLVEQNAKAALGISERCYIMETGRIVNHGSSKEMLGNDKVKAAFLGREYREETEHLEGGDVYFSDREKEG
jgi:branched-chain amino acid transport system ATP-binding protein